MISYRQMRVVGLESIVWPSEKTANIEGVVLASIEVRVVTNMHRQVQLDLIAGKQAFLLEALIALQSLCMRPTLREHLLEELPD